MSESACFECDHLSSPGLEVTRGGGGDGRLEMSELRADHSPDRVSDRERGDGGVEIVSRWRGKVLG